jgi:ABC-2 type transport system permease protein
MISGEANMGTLRLMFAKSYSRTQILLAKFFATSIYTFLLLLWVAMLALFLSILVFGTNDLFLMKSQYIVLIKSDDVFWRYCLAFCYAFVALVTVSAVGFFLSAFAENSIGPIVATMSLIIFFTVLGTLNLPVFQALTPYLFTTHMVTWKEFFDEKVNSDNVAIAGSIQNLPQIFNSLLILFIHIIVLLCASLWVMRKKDILT